MDFKRRPGIKTNTDSPLEYAWALAVAAKNVPLTEEGKFEMMDLNKELMSMIDRLPHHRTLLFPMINEAQKRFGY